MIANMEHYRVFYYVAKHKSISQAAENLYISQPAVSQSIKLLEQSLNCKLFFRTAKGVRLTPEGEKIFPYIENGYENMEEGEKKLGEMLNFESGEIRIGASDMTLQYFLLPHLESFHKKFPKIKIKVSNAPTPETVQSMKAGKIDFGVVSSPIFETEGLKINPVGKVKDVFVGGEKFYKLKDKIVPLEDLERYPVISLEKNTSSTRRGIDKFMSDNGVELSPEIELATSELIVRFAERNLGIGVVAYCFAEDSIKEGKLFQLKMDKEMPTRDICIITNKKTTMSLAGMKFLEDILEND
ncbi:MAG: LysR family transcriptional regulator [Clostridiales bacterium]|nr:LysR family transcriptional regulator [Clostridiales bacterium]